MVNLQITLAFLLRLRFGNFLTFLGIMRRARLHQPYGPSEALGMDGVASCEKPQAYIKRLGWSRKCLFWIDSTNCFNF